MLTHPTVDLLVKLGLGGMARAFTELQANKSATDLGHAEWLALLLEREATERWLKAALPAATPIYDDGRLKVYQTPPKQKTQPYLTLGNGWSKRQEQRDGLIRRTFTAGQSRPELFLHHPQNQPLVLEITATAQTTQKVTLFVNAEQVAQFEVTPNFSQYIISLPPLAAGPVKISLSSDQPTGEVAVSRVSLRISESANGE